MLLLTNYFSLSLAFVTFIYHSFCMRFFFSCWFNEYFTSWYDSNLETEKCWTVGSEHLRYFLLMFLSYIHLSYTLQQNNLYSFKSWTSIQNTNETKPVRCCPFCLFFPVRYVHLKIQQMSPEAKLTYLSGAGLLGASSALKDCGCRNVASYCLRKSFLLILLLVF